MTKAELESDVREAIDDLPVDFTVNGTDYTGTTSAITKSRPLETGGFMEEYDLELVAICQDFTDAGATVPGPGALVTIDGTSYRVARTVKDALGAAVSMFLVGAAK